MLSIPKIPIKKSINIAGKGIDKKSSLSEVKPKRKKYALPGEEGRSVGVAKSKIERAPTVLKQRSQVDAMVSEHISTGRLAKTLARLKREKKEVAREGDDKKGEARIGTKGKKYKVISARQSRGADGRLKAGGDSNKKDEDVLDMAID